MSRTHTDSDSGTDADAKRDTDPKGDADASTVSDAKAATDASTDTDIKADAAASTDNGIKADAAASTDNGIKADADAKAETDAGLKPDTNSDASTDPGADAGVPMPVVAAEAPEDNELPGRLEATAPRQWRNRATPWLFAAVLLAGGFLGGVQVQKTWGKATTNSSGASQSARQTPGFTPPSGFSGGGGFRPGTESQETTGTLKSVTTSALTIRTSDGKTRTVKIAESTRIQQSVTIAKLKPGRPITVQGSTAADGTVTATAVTIS
jgi:hypothetical protein